MQKPSHRSSSTRPLTTLHRLSVGASCSNATAAAATPSQAPPQSESQSGCPVACVNGQCEQQYNSNAYHCQCAGGWTGLSCDTAAVSAAAPAPVTAQQATSSGSTSHGTGTSIPGRRLVPSCSAYLPSMQPVMLSLQPVMLSTQPVRCCSQINTHIKERPGAHRSLLLLTMCDDMLRIERSKAQSIVVSGCSISLDSVSLSEALQVADDKFTNPCLAGRGCRSTACSDYSREEIEGALEF